MGFQLASTIDLLSRTPSVLNALLRDAPAGALTQNEGSDTWSAFDVLGHLIHGEETDWMPRAQIILEHGTARAFEPFDRFAQAEKSQGKTALDLLDEFARLRQQRLAELEALHLTSDQLALRGLHPELGEVTLSELLATWAAHDLGHIAQVVRVLAKQYKNDVGPWKAYLTIVQDK